MTEKEPKKLTKLYGLSLHKTIRNGRFISLKGYKTSIFEEMPKIFSPMAISMQWIPLTLEQSHFLYRFGWRVICDLINILGPFSVIL